MSKGLQLTALTAVSPVDGRYRSKSAPLAEYFSEYAVIRYRIMAEVEYFVALSAMNLPQLPPVSDETASSLRRIYLDFTVDDAAAVKEIEATTNHDVKAVEYFLKRRFADLGLERYVEFIHFGLTSQDINNTAFPLALMHALRDVMLPRLDALREKIDGLAAQFSCVPMLARTHGQPASPTTMGKELRVFSYRLERVVAEIGKLSVAGKFGGATGNFNAHTAAYPDVDWAEFANKFLHAIGLERERYTTQISNYDNLAEILQALQRANTIIIDFDRDIWQYISLNYFKQRIKEGEVGSSAMPHKVNPIDFENSEGNLGMANAVLAHLAAKLPVSRLQRDLTDSTVLRNLGVPLAHMLIAVESTMKGLGKLILNEEALNVDLDDNWAVVAEGIQTILRREGYPKPYEALKSLTRTNAHITRADIAGFIAGLQGISDETRAQLEALTPHNYVGNARQCNPLN